jgi:hypothetical protein
MQCHQTAGAGGVNRHTGALEVEEPANPVRQNCIGDSGGFVLDSRLRIGIEYTQIVVVESADEHGRVRAQGISHGNTGILKGVEDILHDQPLLGIEGQQFILGDIEEGSIKIGRIFSEIMTSLYMKLDGV